MTARRVEWLDRLIRDKRTCWRRCRPNSASSSATRRLVNFSARLKIGACGCMRRYFSARLPPEGRLERAPIGVLVGQNGGRRKILPKKVVNGRVFQWRLWIAGIDHTEKP